MAGTTITGSQIRDNTVTSADIQDGTILAEDLDPSLLTKQSLGLSNVDNTSDLDKPISTAVQAALDALRSEIAASNEVIIPDISLSLDFKDSTGNISKQILLSNNNSIKYSLVTSTDVSNQVLACLSSVQYRAFKVVLQVSSNGSFQATELLIVHDDTTSIVSETNFAYTTSRLCFFDSDIVEGYVRVLVSPINPITTIKATVISVDS